MSGEAMPAPDADAVAKRLEIARILGGPRHVNEFRWVQTSRVQPGDTSPLLARYHNEEYGDAYFLGHGRILEEVGPEFTEPYLLAFTASEWEAFLDGMKRGEFDPGVNPSTMSSDDVAAHNVSLPPGMRLEMADGYITLPFNEAV